MTINSREALLKQAETHAVDLHLRGLYQGEQTIRELAAALATIPEAPKQDAREGAKPVVVAVVPYDVAHDVLKLTHVDARKKLYEEMRLVPEHFIVTPEQHTQRGHVYAAPQPRAEPQPVDDQRCPKCKSNKVCFHCERCGENW